MSGAHEKTEGHNAVEQQHVGEAELIRPRYVPISPQVSSSHLKPQMYKIAECCLNKRVEEVKAQTLQESLRRQN